MGTPAYMAPEQFMMLPTDGRADQFSMCVALYEAIYGHRPFGGRDLAQLMAATIEGLPGLPGEMPGVPLAVRQVIAKGLAKSPDNRFVDMNALVAALEQTRAPTRPAGEGAWQRFGLGMLAGGAVLAIGVGVWLAGDDDEADAPAPVVQPIEAKTDVVPVPPEPAPVPSIVPPSIAELPSVIDAEADTGADTEVAPEVAPTEVPTTPTTRPSLFGVPALPPSETTTTPSALPSLSDLDETEPAADDGATKPEPTEPVADKPADPPKDPPAEPAKEPSADEGTPSE
jgi:serine/threonine protein kinase